MWPRHGESVQHLPLWDWLYMSRGGIKFTSNKYKVEKKTPVKIELETAFGDKFRMHLIYFPFSLKPYSVLCVKESVIT